MTQDQLILLHRIMQMSAEEFAELKKNYGLYVSAVDALRGVVGRQTNADCLASITKYHNEMAGAA
jgi:hypothetical protein